MSKAYVYIIILTTIFLAGCSYGVREEAKFTLKLYERNFSSALSGANLTIGISTIDIFTGCNILENTLSTRDNQITINIWNVTPWWWSNRMPCWPGPASFAKDLSLQDGDYILEFISKGNSNKYSLMVWEKSVSLSALNNDFIETQHTEIKRFLQNELEATCWSNWSYGAWGNDINNKRCQSFFNEINKVATPYIVAEQSKQPKNQFYLYTGDRDTLVHLIKKYTLHGMYVKLVSWIWEVYFCPSSCDSPIVWGSVPTQIIEYLNEPKNDIGACKENDTNCVIEVASTNKDTKLCDTLTSAGDKRDCKDYVWIAIWNPRSCKDGDSSCYIYAAVKNNKPDLCENINENNDKWECYTAYAKIYNDMSFCSKIPETNNRIGKLQRCLDAFK